MVKKKPRHIGIIPDGNRRWAKEHGLRKEEGYEHGLEPGLRLFRMAKENGIEEITYYGFTVDNCKRPHDQCIAFKNACVKAAQILINEGANLLVVGNSDSKCFPQELIPLTKQSQVSSDSIKVNLLVNYGWKWDISNHDLSES